MSWESFYLVCFIVGFLLSLVAFLSGRIHLHGHGVQAHGGHGHGHGGARAPIFNYGTIAAFLAWFGGTGYLLTRYSSLWSLVGLGIAIVSGLGGAAVVFWFVFKVLLARERDLNPADYDMIGVLGRVTSAIRKDGTGEMVFSRDGARKIAYIRSDTGTPIGRGVEVVVTRYERGIAWVRPWEEMNGLQYETAETT
ncbi:MAG: NfeD family protein [Acidobacteriota bacterium]|nr:NfeD family protein [Acidobacteriota bacterium]